MAPVKMRTLVCQEHGGTFQIPSRRGRPPRWCTDEHRCDQYPGDTVRKSTEKPRSISRDTGFRPADAPAKALKTVKDGSGKVVGISGPQRMSKVPADRSVAPKEDTILASRKVADDAQRKLLSIQWKVSRRVDYDNRTVVLTAVRGDELLTMTFSDGECISQDYTLWRTDQTQDDREEDGMPVPVLPFDPEEIPDQELVQTIAGMRVTWWNSLAKNVETAIISAKFSIVHSYDGKGYEHSEDRIFSFVDQTGQGYRAFRLGALISIG